MDMELAIFAHSWPMAAMPPATEAVVAPPALLSRVPGDFLALLILYKTQVIQSDW